jgi:hypothetical protein
MWSEGEEAVMKHNLLGALVLGALLWPVGTFAQTGAATAEATKAGDTKWKPLGGGFEIAILYTNPATQATYLEIRGPGNLHVPRHWHSSNESITVLQGTFVVAHDGSGDKTAPGRAESRTCPRR